MGSVSSTNPGLTDLLQTLSSISPVLSSPSVTSALENASPSDIVQLSTAAEQLQSVDAMFGMTDTTSTDPMTQALDSMFGVPDTSTTDPTTQTLDALLGVTGDSTTTDPTTQSLDAMLGVPGNSSSADPTTQELDAILGVPSTSSTSQTATDLQASEAAALLGAGSTALSGSLLNVLG